MPTRRPTPPLAHSSAQAHNAPGLWLYVNIVEARPRWQARHRHHVANQGVQEASAHRGTHIPDGKGEATRGTWDGGNINTANNEGYSQME